MQEDATTPQAPATVAWPIVGAGGGHSALPMQQLGSIPLIRRIGRGGMGEVWLARDAILGRDVAVKILSTAVAGRDDPAVAGFIAGAKVAAGLGHPGLNQVYQADVIDGTPYLVLEFLDGPNLQERIAHSGRLELPMVRAVVEAMGEAVAELHRHDLVHRDIKPSNIVVTRDGRVVVTDFGLACARPAVALRASSGVVAGTPTYMAPEMFEGVVSARTDVYAIGMTVYNLMCGRPAFVGTLEEIRRQQETTPIDVEPLRAAGVPEQVIDVVLRATTKEILFRPKTARHVLEAFRAAFNAAGIHRAPPEMLARIPSDRPLASIDPPPGADGTESTLSETLAEFAARKRGLRGSAPSLAHRAAEPAPKADTIHLKRRRAERWRVWIAGIVATAAGGWAAILLGLLVMHFWWAWEHWVEVDLAHTSGIRRTADAFSIAGVSPVWARLVVMGAPLVAFVLIPLGVTTVLYRLLRGRPLPPDTENTTCGWCQHELRGISTPTCSECGHRIGDKGPDELGIVPLSRRMPRRLATWTLLPMFFFIATMLAAAGISLLIRLVIGKDSIVGMGGGAGKLNVMPIAVFPGLAITLAFYEAFLQFDLRNSGRAWCRVCKGELRDLVKPVCPSCGTPV